MSIQEHIPEQSGASTTVVQTRREVSSRAKKVHMSPVTCRLIPLLILLPASLAAQTTLDDAIGRLRPGQTVRLHSQTGQRAEGRFTIYHPDPPVVHLAMRDTTIQVAMVDSLWVRKSGAKTGAIIGAVVVGVPSALFWGALLGSLDSGSGYEGIAVGLTVAGAGVGALLGAALGSASTRWQLRYASPQVALKFSQLPTQRFGVGLSIRLPALSR
jgi:hypothetical protein